MSRGRIALIMWEPSAGTSAERMMDVSVARAPGDLATSSSSQRRAQSSNMIVPPFGSIHEPWLLAVRSEASNALASLSVGKVRAYSRPFGRRIRTS